MSKFVRFYRLQSTAPLTEKNAARIADGKKPMGKKKTRLLSYDFTDLLIVDESWGVDDAVTWAKNATVFYAAFYMDGQYHILNASYLPPNTAQNCITGGAICVMPEEAVNAG